MDGLSVDIPLAGGVLHPVRDVSFAVEESATLAIVGKAVDGVSFSLDAGETMAIVGESGCGKSLTSLALMELLPKSARRTARRLEFAGQSLLEFSERQMSDIRGDRMAMIFQDPMTSLNPAYPIGDQLEESLLRHRKVRQRVMIAMGLMCGPELIIADEPTTALDVTIQAQILLLLAELQKEFGMALILITHDLGVVARVADRVAVMYAGQVVETGTAQEVFDRPTHPYTRGLLECIPIPGRTERGSALGSIPGIVPSLVGNLHGCSFRERYALAHAACAEPPTVDFRELGDDRGYRCVLAPEEMASEIAEAGAS